MDAPLYRTKDSQKVQASLYQDRLELINLGANLLNAPSKIDLTKVEAVRVAAAGPGADPKKTTLSLQLRGEPAFTLADLDTAEAHNLKEAIERIKSGPAPQESGQHPFTVGGRVTQKILRHQPISRFGISRF